MSTLIRNRQIVADDYTAVADDAPLPASGNILVSLAYWQKIAPATSALKIGVRIPNVVDVEEHLEALLDHPLIALEFPGFGDGRAYSQARLLRDSGYTGEIRATGQAVVRDQLLGMERCGINSFLLREDQDAERVLSAFGDFSQHYQPTVERLPSVFQRRAETPNP